MHQFVRSGLHGDFRYLQNATKHLYACPQTLLKSSKALNQTKALNYPDMAFNPLHLCCEYLFYYLPPP